MLQLSDADFILLFRSGDKEAFKLIFDSYYARLVEYARRTFKLHDNSLHEEFALHAFTALYKNRQNYQSENHICRSLYIMTKNKGIDYSREVKRKNAVVGRMNADCIEIADETASIIYTKKEKVLHAAIASLPKCRGIVIQALFFEDLTVNEISNKYGLSKQTVWNTKTHAITYLKDYLHSRGIFSAASSLP